jgi:light-regulated signal transduction histidine kinase (bacteriophytochrome)
MVIERSVSVCHNLYLLEWFNCRHETEKYLPANVRRPLVLTQIFIEMRTFFVA